MAFLLFLKFAVKCFDALAWPLLALGYPLCASIWAIEANSNSDIMKLITYWINFSLIALSEHALMMLLQWMPIWPYIKLGIICCMLIPQFDGAFYIYEHLVHPCLHLGPKVLINMFAKSEVSLKRDDFLDEAKKYVEENGYEALENLISNKRLKQSETQKDIRTVLVTEKKELASVNKVKIKEALTGTILAKPVQSESAPREPEAAQVILARQLQEGLLSQSVQNVPSSPASPHLQVPQKESYTSQSDQAHTSPPANIKEATTATTAAASGREIPETPKQVQKEWTCAICQVRCPSENHLNDHFQGKRHKAAIEQLKANIKASKGKASAIPVPKKSDQPTKMEPEKSSSSTADKINKNETKNSENRPKKEKEKCMAKDVGKIKGKMVENNVKNKNNNKYWCAICNLSCNSSVDYDSHTSGQKHWSRLQELVGMASGSSQ